MSAASIPKVFTVEEFAKLPDPPSGRYELHHGEVVLATAPLNTHHRIQRKLLSLLQDQAEENGYVMTMEYAYRPLPESEVWVADVVCVSEERDDENSAWLERSPELTIEVKSPSNTKDQL